MTTQDYGLARRMWHQLEPIHAMFWYAPEVFAEAAWLGYDVQTRWPSYFAWRLAPLWTWAAECSTASRSGSAVAPVSISTAWALPNSR